MDWCKGTGQESLVCCLRHLKPALHVTATMQESQELFSTDILESIAGALLCNIMCCEVPLRTWLSVKCALVEGRRGHLFSSW